MQRNKADNAIIFIVSSIFSELIFTNITIATIWIVPFFSTLTGMTLLVFPMFLYSKMGLS